MSTLDFIALDFETFSRYPTSACQIGLVKVVNGELVDELSLLIKPPDELCEFTHIHGLSWNDVGHQPDFAARWPEIEAFIKESPYLAAHNVGFDKRVMNACCEQIAVVAPVQPWVDTVTVARDFLKIKPTKLNNVMDHFGIEFDHHEALSDARACAGILLRAWQAGWRF